MDNPDKPIRVAYLCEFATLLGGERSLLAYLQMAMQRGIDPVVVCPEEGRLPQRLGELGIERLAWTGKPSQSLDQTATQLAARGVQLIHGNSLMIGRVARALGARLQRPAVTHVRDVMKLSAAAATDLNQLAGLVAVSQAVGDHLVTQGIDPGRIEVVYNAVVADASRTRSELLHRQLGLEPSRPLIGCIGQIALRKGQDLFLDMAERLVDHPDEPHFVLIGERYSQKDESVAFERRLHDRACSTPLAGRIHFAGYLSDGMAAIRALRLLVVPSRQEPLSRAILEAIAVGTPVVATDVGGSREILAEGGGLLAAPDDPDALAEAARTLLDDERVWESTSQAGIIRAGEAFTQARQSARLQQLYFRWLNRDATTSS